MADERDDVRPDPAALRAGYEQLRERVLAGRPDGWRLGHAVLARRGLVGWIDAQTATASAGALRPPQASIAPPAVPALALVGECGQLVAVLAQMALAHAA